MNEALFWLVVGAVFGVIEGMTAGLLSIWFIGGAIVAALIAWLGGGVMVQVLVFFVVSLALLVGTRPFLKRKFDGEVQKTNAETLVGAEAVVVKEISPNSPGEVKVNGSVWRASGGNHQVGELVKITDLGGVTVKVK